MPRRECVSLSVVTVTVSDYEAQSYHHRRQNFFYDRMDNTVIMVMRTSIFMWGRGAVYFKICREMMNDDAGGRTVRLVGRLSVRGNETYCWFYIHSLLAEF